MERVAYPRQKKRFTIRIGIHTIQSSLRRRNRREKKKETKREIKKGHLTSRI
jgi:hypothetical protein